MKVFVQKLHKMSTLAANAAAAYSHTRERVVEIEFP